MRARVLLPVLVLTLGGVGWAAWRASGAGAEAGGSTPGVPTTRVTQGDLVLTVHLEGELRAVREMSLMAPSIGGTLRVLDVLETGTPVREGDVLMTFDPAEQQYAMEQALSEVLEAEQEIIKRKADAAVAAAQDEVALLTARFDVRRAELDASIGQDLIGANAHKIRQVSLEEARRQLTQAIEDAASRATTNKAALTVLEERRTKAQLAADRARQNMDSLSLKAPMDGFVSVRPNQDLSGGFGGGDAPPYRIGDSIFAGRPVLDVLDITGMEVQARVNEQERSNIATGQTAMVRFDGIAGVSLPARVTVVSSLGRPDRATGPLRMFDVRLRLEETDPRLRPGTTVAVTVTGETVPGALLVPRQCIFEKDGKNIVHVAVAGGFEEREVTVLHRTESRAAIEAADGIGAGAVVALVDPTLAARGATAAPTPAAPPAAVGR